MDLKALPLPNGLHVRPSGQYDQAFLNSLYKSTRQDLEFIDDEPDFILHVKEQQQEAQAIGYEDTHPNAMHFIIEYHGEKVGRIVLDFSETEIRVVDISLITKARGKGLGSGVMRSFVFCSEQTKTPLTLSVMSHNIQAKRFYTNLGFIIDQIIPPREHLIYYPSTQGIRIGV